MTDPLQGGYVNVIFRIGETVRRPMNARSPFIHELLASLEEKEVEGVPRFLGVDEEGREIGSLENRNLEVHQRRIPMLANAYGLQDPHQLIGEIIAVQSDCLNDLKAQASGEIPVAQRRLEEAIAAVTRERQWVIDNRAALEAPLKGMTLRL